MISKAKNFISRRENKNVRRTEKARSRATPIGASADAKPFQGAEGTNAAAHSRGRDPRKSLSLGKERRGFERFGGTVMFYRAESRITKKASRETGALTFFPEGRTYSPPTKSAVYCLRQTCALRGYASARHANIFTIVTQERK